MSQDECTDVVTLGETMALMRGTSAGPLAHASTLGLGMGGSESNFAIALRRLGTSVSWIGRLGADSLGDLVHREIRAEDVNTVVVRDASAPTGLMIKERRTETHQKVWYYRSGSAGSKLCAADLPQSLISNAKLLHLTGITPALSTEAAGAVDAAIEIAHAAGLLVSFDLNYRAGLWSEEEAGEAYRAILPKVDVVFAGDEEAAIAVGPSDDPMELARRIAELGPRQVIIKLGDAGAVALIDGNEYRREAIKVPVVDTVGAGDAFVAGYIAELLAGLDPLQRLETAVRTGAFACMVPGDWEGMPRRDELGMLEQSEPVAR
ncbi:sugar kinase [Paeniglutamicibacter sp. ABSL32-1]|uniref:sugar kinase n=1 Tax=Paeniglutamicibacter quisquiliarum TaxID=2849498 RepID=UPI001C2DBF53|nr:sugar kinase [Paeniglutamicibacter quisquiliarum]MBV1777669.1 sugar kinase [Paeniglutamicibacter quisquiliarum]